MLFLDKHEPVQKEYKLHEDVDISDIFNTLLECAFLSDDIVHLEHYNTVNGILNEGVETGIFTRIWEAIKKAIKKCMVYMSSFLNYVKNKFTNLVILIPPTLSECIIEINKIIDKINIFTNRGRVSASDVDDVRNRVSQIRDSAFNLPNLRKYKVVTGKDVKESMEDLQQVLTSLNTMYDNPDISFDNLDAAKKFNNTINTLISTIIKVISYMREALTKPVEA